MAVTSKRLPTSAYARPKESLWQNENFLAFALFVASLIVFLGGWEISARIGILANMPTASLTLKELWWWTTNPFFRQWA